MREPAQAARSRAIVCTPRLQGPQRLAFLVLCQQQAPRQVSPVCCAATEALAGAGLAAREMFIRLSEEESMWVSHPVGPAFPQPPTQNKPGDLICLSD